VAGLGAADAAEGDDGIPSNSNEETVLTAQRLSLSFGQNEAKLKSFKQSGW